MGFRYATGRLGYKKAAGGGTVRLSPTADTSLVFGSSSSKYNYGVDTEWTISASSFGNSAIVRFDLSGIPAGATIVSAVLHAFHSGYTGTSVNRTVNVFQIADANGDWIEGTKDTEQALAGEPCFNAKEADGSGGVTTAWAGSEGLGTAGTDYINTVLASSTVNRADAIGQEYEFTFNASGLDVLQGWFGDATNNGFKVVSPNLNAVDLGARNHPTEAYRPYLEITYS